LESLDYLHVGKVFIKGEVIGTIGDNKINGGWPPHLHFQIISDMLDKKGDYPGVCSLVDRQRFLELCPNPNLILNIGIAD
jgi:murein DD-endopeptidase MepM/ murein hydrolase activator NlpD